MEWYQMDAKKCLEFSKKMAVLRRLVHLGLISENEYILAKNKREQFQRMIQDCMDGKIDADSYGYAGSERGGIHIQECKDGH